MLKSKVIVTPTDPTRSSLINNSIGIMLDTKDGAFNVDIMHESKFSDNDTHMIRINKKNRITAQLQSTELNIRWLLENYLLDDNNNFVIRAHDCIDLYSRDTRFNNIYQILEGNTFKKIKKENIPLDEKCRLETRVAYADYMKDFDLQNRRIVLVDFRNIYCGISGMNPPIVTGLRNACNPNNNVVDYSDENIQIFEDYLYNQIAGRDPNTLYIVIKSNNGSRTNHGFAALTQNIIEYTLNLDKGPLNEVTFVEYDDYTLISLYIILSQFYAAYNLELYILSADNYNWYTPISINGNQPRTYVTNGNQYYELKYYSPKQRSLMHYHHADNKNRYDPPTRAHPVPGVWHSRFGGRIPLNQLFTPHNFFTQEDIETSDKLHGEGLQVIGKLNTILEKYIMWKQNLRDAQIKKLNNNSININEITEYVAYLYTEYNRLISELQRIQHDIQQHSDLSLKDLIYYLDQSIAENPRLLQTNADANRTHSNTVRRIQHERAEQARQAEEARKAAEAEEARIAEEAIRASMGEASKAREAAINYMQQIDNDYKLYTDFIGNIKNKDIEQERINRHSDTFIQNTQSKISKIRAKLLTITNIRGTIGGATNNNISKLDRYISEIKVYITNAQQKVNKVSGNIKQIGGIKRSSSEPMNNNGTRKRGNGPNNRTRLNNGRGLNNRNGHNAKSPNTKKAKNNN